MTQENLPILYLVDASIAVTGAFISARHNARTLAGVMRIVLVLPEGSTIPPQEMTDFWRVEYLPIVNLSKKTSSILRYLPALLHASILLRMRMKKEGAMKLQLNDFFLMHGVILRLLGFRGHIAQWVRCDPKRFVGPLARPMLWLVKQTANRVVAVSAFIVSLLPSGYPIAVAHNFFSGTRREPQTIEAGAEKTFVCIGNYINGKGHDVALRAFALVAAEDDTVKLVFHGGDMGLQKNRYYRKRLEVLARQSGFEDRIVFGEFLADTAPIRAQAFAALNCSISESFSMTVLEASGTGLPVIATASGGPREIIEDGVTGFIVPVGDVAAVADRMRMLIHNPEMAIRMGQAGAARVQECFSQEKFRAKLKSILEL